MFQFNQMKPGAQRIVIMGCGALGANMATYLSQSGHAIHVLDPRPEAFDQLPTSELEARRVVAYAGDGTIQQDLIKVSTPDADVFMALSGSDSMNALAAQIARHVYRIPQVICRIDDPALKDMYNEMGLVAISATTLIMQTVVDSVGA